MAVLVAKLQEKGVVLIVGKNSNGSLEQGSFMWGKNSNIAPCQFLTIFALLVGVWCFSSVLFCVAHQAKARYFSVAIDLTHLTVKSEQFFLFTSRSEVSLKDARSLTKCYCSLWREKTTGARESVDCNGIYWGSFLYRDQQLCAGLWTW